MYVDVNYENKNSSEMNALKTENDCIQVTVTY